MKTPEKTMNQLAPVLTLLLTANWLVGCESASVAERADFGGAPEYEADPWPEPDPMPVFLNLILWINPVHIDDLENNLSDYRVEVTNESHQISTLIQRASGDLEGPVHAEPKELITITVIPNDEIEAPETVTVTFDETDEEILVPCRPDCSFDFIVPDNVLELNISIDLPD
jgi:hypothetical protein